MTRTVEIRRHSYTKKGERRGSGSHLSDEGVRLARRVGESIGPFAKVIASDVPRTLETAIAMGFAVDEILPFGEGLEWDAVIEELGWHALWDVDQPFEHLAEMMPSRPQTLKMAKHYADRWLQVATSLRDGEAALVVSHGQLIEAGLVAALPHGDHASWGPPFSHCEGARLTTNADAFTAIEIMRVSTDSLPR